MFTFGDTVRYKNARTPLSYRVIEADETNVMLEDDMGATEWTTQSQLEYDDPVPWSDADLTVEDLYFSYDEYGVEFDDMEDEVERAYHRLEGRY